MKKILLLSGLGLVVSGCDPSVGWEQNCAAHYSTNARELSECKAKVRRGDVREIEAETVGIDPGNASRPRFDDIGKSDARDGDNS